MRRMLALPLLIVVALATVNPCSVRAAGRAMTVDDLLAVRSVSDPQVAPDGKEVVYVVSEIDREAGKTNSSLWMVPVAGGPARRLTTTPGVNNHPRWSPDGKTIAFISSRGSSAQVWVLPVDGGEAWQFTKLPVDVAGPVWSPRGDRIAFSAEVYPGKTVEQTAAKDKEKEASKSKARVHDSLMFRHWTAWDEGKRSHLFVTDVVTREVTDVTPTLQVNAPPAPFGGSDDYTWAPDGRALVFTAEPVKDGAWSTNTDLWEVSVPGGKLRNLTEENPGADEKPAFSPDGHWLAFLRQTRAGFESDLRVLTLLWYDTGATFELTRTLDRPVQSFAWSGWDQLLAVIDEAGTEPAVLVEFGRVIDGQSVTMSLPQTHRVVKGGAVSALQATRKDGAFLHPTTLVFVRSTADHPGELYKASSDGTGLSKLTHHNDGLVAGLDLAKAEPFTFKGADGADVSGWLVKPPGFDPRRKYPVAFLIHGGPQGAWHDEWHARWNYAMFASPGFAVVAVNPRGSTGYGQKFTDQISQDWTGRVYDDLMQGLDFAMKTYPFLDGDRVAAAGGSYGGFMVNWMAGHTDRFKALVSHAGVYDLTSEYGATEELWFPEWEFGGPPWDRPEHYREHSPSSFVKNFKTPTLVVHGALDYRVPDGQGLGLFTALQRRGVPSRLVYFPDEGHWILKPGNRVLWWNEVLGWMGRYLKK